MSLENLLRVNENINALDNDIFFRGMEFEIENIFSENVDKKELRKLSKFNHELNQYIDFIDKTNENFFSKKALSRLIKLKKEIYNKTNELIDYKENLDLFNEHFINLKKYVHALDLVLSDNESNINLEKYHRDLFLISEIKIKINQTNKTCSEYLHLPAKKIVQYCDLLNYFIDKELNYRLDDLNLFIKQYKIDNNSSEKDKLYFEEVQNYIKDCSDIIKNTIKISN